jgi:hypothetical protein
MLSIAEL